MRKRTNQFLLSSFFVVLFMALFSAAIAAENNAIENHHSETHNDIELFAKAVSFSSQNLWAQAEPLYREIIKRNNEWPEPANNLAILLLKTNRIAEAKKMFEQAVVSAPNYRVAQKNRSELYSFLATQAYDKALGAEHSIKIPELELIKTIYQPVKVIEIEIEVEKVVIQKEIVEVAATPEFVPTLDIEQDTSQQQPAERIKQLLIAWSRAWSQGDFEYYIQTYSKYFQPSDARKTYTEWKNIRRAKLKFTKDVNINIEKVRVFINAVGDYALVEFTQNYQSKTYHDKVLKQMYMGRQQDNWLILSERTIKTYKK